MCFSEVPLVGIDLALSRQGLNFGCAILLDFDGVPQEAYW
jgi:hypothetical protein